MIASRAVSPMIALATLSVAILCGCTSAGTAPVGVTSAAATTTSAAASDTDVARQYVEAVNALCDQTMAAVQQIVPQGYTADTPVTTYRLDAPRLRKVYDAFDQQFAALPVPPPARDAASAFRAYVVISDRTKAAALAAASSQASFAAEFARQSAYFTNNPVMQARDRAGFASNCNYR